MEKGWKERECRTSDYIIHKGCSVCIKYAVQYENSETHSAKHSEIMSALNTQPQISNDTSVISFLSQEYTNSIEKAPYYFQFEMSCDDSCYS